MCCYHGRGASEGQAEAEATSLLPTTSLCAKPLLRELEDKHIPAKEFLEKKLAELESGEFRAEPLTPAKNRVR